MVELGRFSLIGAWIVVPFAILFYFLFLKTKDKRFFISAQRGVILSVIFVVISSIGLWFAFLTRDFSLEYVASYSDRTLPIIYTISAFWAGMDGSLLFWALVLSLLILWILIENKDSTKGIDIWAGVVNLGVLYFFLTLLVFLSSPFKSLGFTPPDGSGLNPMLQNSGMFFHPTTLYFGYVGFTIPFAYAMASLIMGKIDSYWVIKVRKWTIISWIFLTVGNILGAMWAYVELGWGGYWAWDPVENASFMPWLTGTAFLHSVMMQERRDMLKVWNLLLIMITFGLTIFGTYITRSGVLQSVHAFAQSNLGPFFGAFIGGWVIVFVSLLLYRWDKLKSQRAIRSVLSREGTFFINNWILLIIAFTIFWGVLFPIIAEIVRGVKITVGPPFFEQVTIPFFIILLLIMGICPSISWRKATLKGMMKTLLLPLILAVITTPVLYFSGVQRPLPLLGLGLALFVFYIILYEIVLIALVKGKSQNIPFPIALFRLLNENRRRYGGFVVHIGVIMTAAGIILSSAFKKEIKLSLKPGEKSEFMGYSVQYTHLMHGGDPHYDWVQAPLRFVNNTESFTLFPEKRFYRTWQDQPNTEVDIQTTLGGDFYAILEGWDKGEEAFLRILFHPFIYLIWWGGVVMVLGGMFALIPKRNKNKEV